MSLALPEPLRIGPATISDREYAAVWVETEDGVVGNAYCLTRGGPVAACVDRLIAPVVVGTDSAEVTGSWERCFRANVMIGRTGLVMRGLGLVDVALWDIAAQRAGVPLHRLLGNETAPVEMMMVAAYPVAGRSADDLATDVLAYAARGYRHLKIARSADERVMRPWVEETCAGLPFGSRLVVDAGYGWTTADEALSELAAWGDVELGWLEDPVVPEDARAIARIRREGRQRIGVGDEVSDKATYDALLAADAVDVLRLDVLAIGGVTAALAVLESAEHARVSVSFHVYPEVSVHLAAGVNGSIIETFDPEIPGGNPFEPAHLLLDRSLPVVGGCAIPPDTPGLGFQLDRTAFPRVGEPS